MTILDVNRTDEEIRISLPVTTDASYNYQVFVDAFAALMQYCRDLAGEPRDVLRIATEKYLTTRCRDCGRQISPPSNGFCASCRQRWFALIYTPGNTYLYGAAGAENNLRYLWDLAQQLRGETLPDPFETSEPFDHWDGLMATCNTMLRSVNRMLYQNESGETMVSAVPPDGCPGCNIAWDGGEEMLDLENRQCMNCLREFDENWK